MDTVLILSGTDLESAMEEARSRFWEFVQRTTRRDVEAHQWPVIEEFIRDGRVRLEQVPWVNSLLQFPPATDPSAKWGFTWRYGPQSEADLDLLPPGIAALIRKLELMRKPFADMERAHLPRTTGVIGREDLSTILHEAPPAIETERQKIAAAMVSSGVSDAKVNEWLKESRNRTDWPVPPSLNKEEGPIVRMGSFLDALYAGAKLASEWNVDLFVGRELGGQVKPIDWRHIQHLVARRDRKALKERLDRYIEWATVVETWNAMNDLEDRPSINTLIETTPPANKWESDDEGEVFGHYLSRRLGLPLAKERGEGYTFTHEFTAPEIVRLREVLEEVAENRLHQDTIYDLAAEFGYSDEMAGGVVGWFAGKQKDEHVRKRMKIEMLAAQAASGKKMLLFVHQEE